MAVVGVILKHKGTDGLSTKLYAYALVTVTLAGLMVGFNWFVAWPFVACADIVVSFVVVFIFFDLFSE